MRNQVHVGLMEDCMLLYIRNWLYCWSK